MWHRLQHEPIRQCRGKVGMESFFSSLNGRTDAHKISHQERGQGQMCSTTERLYNAIRRSDTSALLSSNAKVGLLNPLSNQTGNTYPWFLS
jgi:hypothetical protein